MVDFGALGGGGMDDIQHSADQAHAIALQLPGLSLTAPAVVPSLNTFLDLKIHDLATKTAGWPEARREELFSPVREAYAEFNSTPSIVPAEQRNRTMQALDCLASGKHDPAILAQLEQRPSRPDHEPAAQSFAGVRVKESQALS